MLHVEMISLTSVFLSRARLETLSNWYLFWASLNSFLWMKRIIIYLLLYRLENDSPSSPDVKKIANLAKITRSFDEENKMNFLKL